MFAKIIDTFRKIRSLSPKIDQLTVSVEKVRAHSEVIMQLAIEDYVARILRATPRYRDPKRLTNHEFKVYSQSGEDGILEEIFNRIGYTTRFFVEFGVGTGLENNTAYLLLKNWTGVWLEANPDYFHRLQHGFKTQINRGHLRVYNTPVTAENVETLFATAQVPAEFDLLSIDIDGNDYWVWRAINTFVPRVVVIEYNAMFPSHHEWIMAYNPTHRHGGGACFGASLKPLELLGRSKGYCLVACSLSGANAFFVREDLAKDHFAEPFTAENHYEPARYYLTYRSAGHARTFESFQSCPAELTGPPAAPK